MNDYNDRTTYTFKNSKPEIKDEDLVDGLSYKASQDEVFDVLYGNLPDPELRCNNRRLRDKYLAIYHRLELGGIIFEGDRLCASDGTELIAPHYEVKLYDPMYSVIDREKKIARWIKYKSPTGKGKEPVFLPKFTRRIKKAIASRWGIEINSWDEVIANNLPIMITEGAKKARRLMEEGFLAISVSGIYGGIRTTGTGWEKRLIVPLQIFAQTKREFILAFDEDENHETRAKVYKALVSNYFAFKAVKAEVSFLRWSPSQGKGIDDYINSGGDIEALVRDRISLEQLRLQRYSDLSQIPTTKTDTQFFDAALLLDSTAKIKLLKGEKATGKTVAIKTLVEERKKQGVKVMVLGHLRSLTRANSELMGLTYCDDMTNQTSIAQAYEVGWGQCVDSLSEYSAIGFNPEHWRGATLIIDEVDQFFSATCLA